MNQAMFEIRLLALYLAYLYFFGADVGLGLCITTNQQSHCFVGNQIKRLKARNVFLI
jgi:hypothetical protein